MTPNKRILVTGAAGFIGSHLARRLVREGYRPFCLTRSEASGHRWRLADLDSSVSWVRADLSEKSRMREIMRDIRPLGIFHCAASNIMSGVTEEHDAMFSANVAGTINLIEAARDIDYAFFIHSGSFLEYGPHENALSESMLCEPQEPYAFSKLSGSLYARMAGKLHKKPIVIFRIFTPYGPFIQKGRLVYEIITRAQDRLPLALTHPGVTRDFIFVEDISDLYMEAMRSAERMQGEIFNAGSGCAVRLDALARSLIEKIGSPSPIQWNTQPSVSYDSSPWQADMEKTFSSFSWRPRHTLDEGLEKTIAWLGSHRGLYPSA